MDEYAADKVQFLKRLYDFDENDDINRFTAKLTGANKGKRRYAEAKNYATSLINVYNKFAEGGIIKAQNGSKSEELLIKKALEFGQKTSEKMSPYDVRLIDFIKSKEGFRPKPEKDKTDGKWTVGYGLTDPKLIRKYRNGITEEEASKHLIQHLQMGADSLATMPYYDNLNLGEKTALNDLIYNVGWNKFKNSKRLQSHLRTGNDAGAKKEMNHGEHQARGLKIRRNQNRQMYDSTFSWKYKKGGVAKYQEPAQGINRSAIRTDEDRKVPKYNRAVYSSVNPIWGIPNNIIQAGRLSTQARIKSWRDDQDNMEYSVGTQIGDSVADAAWRKRLGLSYDSKFLPKFNGDTVRLPKQLEMEIPTDTNMLKKRIANTERLMKRSSKYKNSTAVNVALKSDQRALKALRDTYKTGKAVGLDEYSNNSRQLVENGEINEEYISPLNVFRNYNIRYDKDTDKMYYSKSYDFDTVEHNWDKFVPGTKFYIRGSIDLNKK